MAATVLSRVRSRELAEVIAGLESLQIDLIRMLEEGLLQKIKNEEEIRILQKHIEDLDRAIGFMKLAARADW